MAKRSLGRGLGDILGEVAEAYEKEIPQNEVVEIPLDEIRKNPYQPRKHFDEAALQELADSIKEHGLLQPVVVIEDIDGFMLIAGERRLRAAKMAGLEKIKAIVARIDDGKYRELALIENIQRQDLTPLELAQAYKELIEEYGITHEELAQIVKKSRAHITNTLRLLQLGAYAQKALEEGRITPGHARTLVGLDEEQQRVMVDSIVGQKLSVRDVESMAKRETKKSKKAKEALEGLATLCQHLQKKGYRARCKENKIMIEFTNRNEIETFLQILDANMSR
jgi:ParB family chromosome partitioning protein